MPHTLALFNDVGGGELLIIGIAALLLFGKELPAVTRKVGRVIAQFKRGMAEASAEINREMNAAADSVEKAKRDAAASADISAETREIDDAVRKGISSTAPPIIKPDLASIQRQPAPLTSLTPPAQPTPPSQPTPPAG